jgi:hypothetical protein
MRLKKAFEFFDQIKHMPTISTEYYKRGRQLKTKKTLKTSKDIILFQIKIVSFHKNKNKILPSNKMVIVEFITNILALQKTACKKHNSNLDVDVLLDVWVR